MQKCCFSTYVHGWYQDFIPTYIFSILHAFPNHYVKIFLHEKLNDYNKEALNLIDNKNYQIIETSLQFVFFFQKKNLMDLIMFILEILILLSITFLMIIFMKHM